MGFSIRIIQVCLLLALGGVAVAPARAARNDDNVEWDGGYSDETFRSPRHPGAGEDFTLEVRVFRGDLDAARIRTFDGETRRYDMAWVRNEGPVRERLKLKSVVPNDGRRRAPAEATSARERTMLSSALSTWML